MMLIHNVRLGFATNSSSQHSMIFLDNQKDSTDGDDKHHFGWQHFTAASRERKGVYFGVLVMNALRSICDERTAGLIAADLLGHPMPEPNDAYIDHQSEYGLPVSWNERGIDHEFASEFRDFLLQEGLVVLGGNDNGDKGHPLLAKASGFKLALPQDEWHGSLVARKDPDGFWTLFNRLSGAKTRFRFPRRNSRQQKNGQLGAIAPAKTYAPELIDIKITDFCPHGCHFCYQDSGPAGKHAEWKNSYGLLDALERMRVFEVAIGGGEPVSHPHFAAILHDFRRHHIVPSFSTRDLSWLRDPRRWQPILEATGSFAYSVDNPNQSIEEFAATLNAYGFRRELEKLVPQPTVHHVMIGDYGSDLKEFLRSAYHHDLHVVLLGHKLVGRGSRIKPKTDSSWVDTVAELNKAHECPRLSIDTALAKTFGKKLGEAGVPDWLIETKEGKFSMYIDLVKGEMGPSSFCAAEDKVPLEWTSWSDKVMESVLGAFSKW